MIPLFCLISKQNVCVHKENTLEKYPKILIVFYPRWQDYSNFLSFASVFSVFYWILTFPICKKVLTKATGNQKITLLNKKETEKKTSRGILIERSSFKKASQLYLSSNFQAKLVFQHQEGSPSRSFPYCRLNNAWAGYRLWRQRSPPSWWGKHTRSGTFKQDPGREYGLGGKNLTAF